MKNVLVTFSGKAYDEATGLIVERGLTMGADEVMVFDDRWLIDTGYVAMHPWLYQPEPSFSSGANFGFGYCSWKAFVILSAMDKLQDGDVVLYTDADTYPVNQFWQLFERCRQAGGVFLFTEHGCSTLRFTKGDCFLAMGMPIKESVHGCGRFSLWQKGPLLSRQMLTEWWAYSVNPRCMLWDKSILQPDQPEFYRNSTEQSVLTNLGVKYGVPFHRNPDQGGVDQQGLPGDDYPQLFEQKYCTGDRADVSGSSHRGVHAAGGYISLRTAQ